MATLRSRACKECIRRKVFCDGKDIAPSLDKSLSEYKRLAAEEEEILEQLQPVLEQLSSVRRKKKASKVRADRLFRRGMIEYDKEVRPPGEGATAPSAGLCRFSFLVAFNNSKWSVGAVVARFTFVLLDVRS